MNTVEHTRIVRSGALPRVDGETIAKIEINSAQMISTSGVKEAWTLSGESVRIGEDTADPSAAEEDGEPTVADGGETLE